MSSERTLDAPLATTDETVLSERRLGTGRLAVAPGSSPADERVEVTVEAATVRLALDELSGAGPVRLDARHGALELTVQADEAGSGWTTAVVPATERRGSRPRATATVGFDALADAVPTIGPISVAFDGRLEVAGHRVPAAAPTVGAPPRPTAGTVVDHRVELPDLVTAGIAQRLEQVHLWLPPEVRERFSARRISLATLYEHGGTWFLSGVRDGQPLVVVVAAVNVY